MVGALLIGDFPHPYQWVVAKSANPRIPDTREELISFQYYTDLDGSFEASPGYKSRGNHAFSYDVHDGNVDWEIWLGILPIYKGDVATTIEAINRYFAKNHAYRLGQSGLPRAFMQISEHAKSTSVEQDETNLENKKNGALYFGDRPAAPRTPAFTLTPQRRALPGSGLCRPFRGVATLRSSTRTVLGRRAEN